MAQSGSVWPTTASTTTHPITRSCSLWQSFNGHLYAGTWHGDWYDDGHPDGPLGGEVWRSGDGTTWTHVNTPGFGNLEAYRVESLHVFQNGLYAYASHV